MRKRVKKLIESVIDKSLKMDNPSADDIEDWDSLAHLNILSAIETNFNVTIPIEQFPNLTSLDKITSYLEQHL